jgi:hypothetical protein
MLMETLPFAFDLRSAHNDAVTNGNGVLNILLSQRFP